jgi:hypothetical protein
MENADIQTLHGEWQSAVRAHEAMIRNGKMSGLSSAELDELGRAYILRIDAAFRRLKEAEAQQADLACTLFR